MITKPFSENIAVRVGNATGQTFVADSNGSDEAYRASIAELATPEGRRAFEDYVMENASDIADTLGITQRRTREQAKETASTAVQTWMQTTGGSLGGILEMSFTPEQIAEARSAHRDFERVNSIETGVFDEGIIRVRVQLKKPALEDGEAFVGFAPDDIEIATKVYLMGEDGTLTLESEGNTDAVKALFREALGTDAREVGFSFLMRLDDK